MADSKVKRLIQAMGEDKGLAECTKHSYAVALRNLCAFMGGFEAAIFVTREDASTWVEKLRQTSDVTAQNYARSASAVFTYLCEQGVLDENVFKGLLPAPHPGLNKPYSEAVSLPEIRRILSYTSQVGEDPVSTPTKVTTAALALLHVRYCIPYSSLSNMRVSDYRSDCSRSAVSWRNTRTGVTEYTELDSDVSSCIDRTLSFRGSLSEDDYLFTHYVGKNKGGKIRADCLRERVGRFYREAGVSVGRRNLKLAAVQLAANTGAGMAEVYNLNSSMGLPMAYKTTRDVARKSVAELWNSIGIEFDDKLPIAKGVVSVQELREALDLVAGIEHVRFEVAFDGRLSFSVAASPDE